VSRVVKLNLVSASGALNILLKPFPEAIKMKNVTAFKFLRLFYLLQANNAGVIYTCW
jgi:hypothetical protein